MKPIQAFKEPTPGLRTYLAEEIDETGSWAGFRNHAGGDSYSELVKALVEIQHGLCGYCEIDIRKPDRQVEHVIPQSDAERGTAQALNQGNMIACCKGGTLQTGDAARRLDPVRRNRSCGEAKGARMESEFIDPRTLPALPALTRVSFDGRMQADAIACEQSSIPIHRVEKTIEILALNAERLRRAREHRWNALTDHWTADAVAPELMEAAASFELLPNTANLLPRFFTTSRSYFGVYGEEVLSKPPRNWT